MFRLPISQLVVELRPYTGAEDMLLLESREHELWLSVALVRRLAKRSDGKVLDAAALPLPDVEALLLEMRRTLFGDVLHAKADCHARGCGQRTDIAFSIGDYLAHRRPRTEADSVLVDARGLPLRYIAVKETFDRLVDKAGIKSRSGRRPRLHDLRHTFAVRALQASPAGRSRSGAHMAALSTYMGHVNIYATYWYLEATADFLRDVATASEAFMSEGRSA